MWKVWEKQAAQSTGAHSWLRRLQSGVAKAPSALIRLRHARQSRHSSWCTLAAAQAIKKLWSALTLSLSVSCVYSLSWSITNTISACNTNTQTSSTPVPNKRGLPAAHASMLLTHCWSHLLMLQHEQLRLPRQMHWGQKHKPDKGLKGLLPGSKQTHTRSCMTASASSS